MIRFVQTKKCVLLFLPLVVLVVATASGGTKTVALKKIDSEVEKMEDLLHESINLLSDHIDDEPELEPKTLVARAAELSPDPDNAALLYYQALLLRHKPDAETEERIYKVLRGGEPDEKVRKYLKSCNKTIKLTEAAAQIPECNWGILYSQGFGFNSEQLRHFRILLSLDARTLAADGHYREALGRCLTIRRLARHIHRFFSRSVEVDRTAFLSIRHILGSMPPDTDTLIWLQGQLTTVPGAPLSSAKALEMDFEFFLRTVRTETKTLSQVRKHLAKKADDNSTRRKIQDLSDEELLRLARQTYERFLNSVLWVIGSDMPYEKTYAEIQRLKKKLKEKADHDPVIILWPCLAVIDRIYGFQVLHATEFNALRVAIEIFLVKARTGRLPKTLPDYLPKDPYSGQDFKYEITEEGFVLRSRVKAIGARKVQQYEFKVQK